MNWQRIVGIVGDHLMALGVTFGLGGGVGIIKLLAHWPAPLQENIYWGAIFDWLQDLVSNRRIGERRTREGVIVPPVPAPKEVPASVAAPTEPNASGKF
jgi:hypothetical protein